jgi:hypothetical protein
MLHCGYAIFVITFIGKYLHTYIVHKHILFLLFMLSRH